MQNIKKGIMKTEVKMYESTYHDEYEGIDKDLETIFEINEEVEILKEITKDMHDSLCLCYVIMKEDGESVTVHHTLVEKIGNYNYN